MKRLARLLMCALCIAITYPLDAKRDFRIAWDGPR